MGAAVADRIELAVHVEEGHLLALEVDHAAGAHGHIGQVGDARPSFAIDLPLRRRGERIIRRAQAVQRLADAHGDAGEDRRIAQGVHAGLRLSQLHHQVQEVARLVRLERDDELLVIQAVGVGGVQLHRGILSPHRDVLIHHALAVGLAQLVPGSGLHEGIDEEVLGVCRLDQEPARARRLFGADVDGTTRHGQVGVRVGEIRPHGGAEELRRELLDVFQPVGDLPEQEIGVGARPGQAVAADEHPVGEGSGGITELLLPQLTLLRRQPAPGGGYLIEGIGDELTSRRLVYGFLGSTVAHGAFLPGG